MTQLAPAPAVELARLRFGARRTACARIEAEAKLRSTSRNVAGARAFPRLAPMLAAVGANLALAARRTHAWYLETFPEYPKNRWAMVPGLL